MELASESFFYVPKSPREWRFLDSEASCDSRIDAAISLCWVYIETGRAGIFNHSNYNENLLELLSKLEIDNFSNESLLKMLQREAVCSRTDRLLETFTRQAQPDEPELTSETQISAIYEAYNQKRSPAAVAIKYGIDPLELKLLLSKYKRNVSKLKSDNRRWMNKRKKLSGEILETIREFLESHKYSNFTLDDLRIFLIKKHGETCTLSNSTIGRCLKRKFNMFFRKINKVNPKVFYLDSRRKMLEAVALQIKLSSRRSNVIYIDEFKYSSRANNLYGWTVKGRSGYSKEISLGFQASFIIAFLTKKICGVCATTKTYDASKFKYFLGQLLMTEENCFALVCDNAKIHVAKLTEKFLVEQQTCLITIPAYCPFVNACEKLILIIKSKIRKLERQGRLISLGTFKKCLDSIDSSELEGCVKESFKETFNLLQ